MEYTVERISEKPPREWEGKHGTVYYIKTKLSGHNKPVEIGKKSPNALSVGEKVYGTIEATEYESDRFKAERKPFTGGGKDEGAIKAMWAIGQSVQLAAGSKASLSDVEKVAKELFKMVDRVKENKQSGYEQARATAQSLREPAPEEIAYVFEGAELTEEDFPL